MAGLILFAAATPTGIISSYLFHFLYLLFLYSLFIGSMPDVPKIPNVIIARLLMFKQPFSLSTLPGICNKASYLK
jgi:hypothetical protein